jgi:hypothetical protein
MNGQTYQRACFPSCGYGDPTTPERALHFEAKVLDAGDQVPAKAVTYKIIHSLRQQCPRGKIADAGKRGTSGFLGATEFRVKIATDLRNVIPLIVGTEWTHFVRESN